MAHLAYDRHALAAFCHRHHVRRLRLFGSVLRDDFRPDSDVDVLVEFEPGRAPGFFTIFDMERELSTILDGRRIDLKTAEDLGPWLRARVDKEAETVYAAA